MPSMPDSLVKDAAKYAQKGVFENLQNNQRCGRYAGVDSADAERKQIMNDLMKLKLEILSWMGGEQLATADEAKQEHERMTADGCFAKR
jgi:hypothetical protein